MSETAANLTTLVAGLTLIAQLGIAGIVIALFLEKRRSVRFLWLDVMRRWSLKLTLLVALVGSILTLVYSEVFGILPCGLCWLQRVFMYPLVVLLGIALWKRDSGVSKYVIGLAVPGLLIALYHHFIQVGGTDFLPCPATPGVADCAQRFIFEFGYITFPLMAVTAFALLILLAVLHRQRN